MVHQVSSQSSRIDFKWFVIDPLFMSATQTNSTTPETPATNTNTASTQFPDFGSYNIRDYPELIEGIKAGSKVLAAKLHEWENKQPTESEKYEILSPI